MATFGDPGRGKAEGRGQKAKGKKEGKFPKFIWYKGFKTSAFCLLPSALKPFSVLITKIGQEPKLIANKTALWLKLIANRLKLRFLATFGDLGWGEGRGQKAEGRSKKKEEGRSGII